MLAALLGLVAVGSDLAAPAPVRAQDEAALAEARSLFSEGLTRADEQRWGEAVEYFRRALTIVERPSIVFNLGVALFRLGRTLEATETLQHYLEIAEAIDDAAGIGEARAYLAEIEGAIGVLILHVSPASAELEVDGVLVAGEGAERTLRLDPGAHRVILSAERREDTEFEVSVLPGARAERTITLAWHVVDPAHLHVLAPANTPVFLDDDRVGRGSLEIDVAAGEHVVRIGTEPETRIALDVQAGEARTVGVDDDGNTVDSGARALAPPTRAPSETGSGDAWIWGIVAVSAAAAIGVGVGVGVWAASAPTDAFAGYGGTTGVVITSLSF